MPDRAIFLLVDDNEDDVELIRRAFLKARVLNPVFAVNSGEEAISYLAGEGKYARRTEFPLPSLVLLDLHMPGLDGFDVLRWIRQQPHLVPLRVIALTASQDMRDADKAYKAGANSFLVKPADFQRFVEISQALAGYWIRVDTAPQLNELPPAVSPRVTDAVPLNAQPSGPGVVPGKPRT